MRHMRGHSEVVAIHPHILSLSQIVSCKFPLYVHEYLHQNPMNMCVYIYMCVCVSDDQPVVINIIPWYTHLHSIDIQLYPQLKSPCCGVDQLIKEGFSIFIKLNIDCNSCCYISMCIMGCICCSYDYPLGTLILFNIPSGYLT